MYKITLYDNNCCPIADGVTYFFTDNLDEFEKNWRPHVREEKWERYERSKAGEIVTDYYGDSPELNIVQEDKNAEILFEKVLHIYQKEDFKEDSLETYCFVTVGVYSEEELLNGDIDLESDETFVYLMRDIPGEAG